MSTFPHGFPGVTIWPIADGRALSVGIDHSTPERDPRVEGEVEKVWATLTKANRKLFDGPILALASFDPGSGLVTCRRESYKRLTVQGEVETGVVLMAVNGLVIARDRAGDEQLLLGRRSVNTRMYGGMWELIPAGGLEPPAEDATEVSREHLLRQLSVEMREEAGLNVPVEEAGLIAFYRDEFARSFNIVFACHLATPIEDIPLVERDWDCDAVWWLPRSEAREFERKMPIIPPSRGLMRMAGWIGRD